MSGSNDPIDTAVASERLRTLCNPARLRIVFHLLEGERSVGEIAAALGLQQPSLSQHLGELRDAGFVVARREAKAVFYRLADEEQRRLVQALIYGFGGAAPLVEPRFPIRRPRAQMLGAAFATVEGST